MPLRKRGESWQVDLKIEGQRVRKDFKTEGEAKAYLRQYKTSTIKELFDEFYALTWEDGRDAVNTRRITDQLIEFFGPANPPSSISLRRIHQFILSRKSLGNSESTIDRKLVRLNMLLQYCHEIGELPEPIKAKTFGTDNKRERFLTDAECDELVNLLRVSNHRDLFHFLLDTGCRVGEAFALEWRGVMDRSVSFYKTKNDRPRTIPITDRVKALLAQRRALQRPFSDITRRHFEHDFKMAKKHSSMRDDDEVVLHTLRHTLASRLAQSGKVDLYRIKAWLGHTQIKTTERYAHLIPSSLDVGLEVLN